MLALFLAFPLSFLPGEIGRYAPLVTAVVLGVIGATAGAVKRNDLSAFAQGVRGIRRGSTHDAKVLLDTSIIIDGRISDVVRAGFVRGTLIIPKFVLAELQYFNDSPDGSRRERGRRGLEMLAKMQKEETVKVELSEEEPAGTGADGKLVTLARTLGIPIMTNDYGLNRVAELQGITVLNVNDLAKAVRPVVLPSDELTVPYLLFTGNVDGDEASYLRALVERSQDDMHEIWSHCIGYEYTGDDAGLVAHLLRNRLPTNLLFTPYPTATVEKATSAVKLRKAFIEFAVRSDGIPAVDLQRDFLDWYRRQPEEVT